MKSIKKLCFGFLLGLMAITSVMAQQGQITEESIARKLNQLYPNESFNVVYDTVTDAYICLLGAQDRPDHQDPRFITQNHRNGFDITGAPYRERTRRGIDNYRFRIQHNESTWAQGARRFYCVGF